MTIYLVMRTEDLRSDGYYCESETTIIGSREIPEDASALLNKAASIVHKDEKPTRGAYNKYGNTELVFDIPGEMMEDRFWVERIDVGKYYDKLPEIATETTP